MTWFWWSSEDELIVDCRFVKSAPVAQSEWPTMGVSESGKLEVTIMQETTIPPKSPPAPEKKHIFDILAETFDDLPEEMLAQLPTDGAENHDHYLYGWPKKSETADHETAEAE